MRELDEKTKNLRLIENIYDSMCSLLPYVKQFSYGDNEPEKLA